MKLNDLFSLAITLLLLSSCASSSSRVTQTTIGRERGSVSSISKVVRSHYNDLRLCYGDALLKDPSVKGKALVEFSVEPGKPPKPIKIKDSSLNNKTLDRCILAQFKKWDFPQETELKSAKLSVTYPVELKPVTTK
jgi:outer membrane biosynthesis protein TonB